MCDAFSSLSLLNVSNVAAIFSYLGYFFQLPQPLRRSLLFACTVFIEGNKPIWSQHSFAPRRSRGRTCDQQVAPLSFRPQDQDPHSWGAFRSLAKFFSRSNLAIRNETSCTRLKPMQHDTYAVGILTISFSLYSRTRFCDDANVSSLCTSEGIAWRR